MKFNDKNFDRLWKSDKPSLEQIMVVLSQTSDTSRQMMLNHNCLISGLPFTWKYEKLYEPVGTYIRVLTIPMYKISTGFDFFLDIEETGEMYLSQGKGTRRTKISLSYLMSFRPTVQKKIYNIINWLCKEQSDDSLFDFYKSFEDCRDCDVPDVLYTWYVENRDETFALQYIQNASKIVSYGKDQVRKDHYDLIKKFTKSCHAHIIHAAFCKEHNCWYADIIFAGEAWQEECLRDPSSYKVNVHFTKDEFGALETLSVHIDDDHPDLPKKLKVEMEDLVRNIVSRAYDSGCYDSAKEGAWFGYTKPQLGKDWVEPTRDWQSIPESNRIPFFIKPHNRKHYYQVDDLVSLDLRKDGETIFKNSHHIAEEN